MRPRCCSSNSFRRCDTTRIFHIIDTSFTDRASLYFSLPFFFSRAEKNIFLYLISACFHLSPGVYLSPTSCVVVAELKHQRTIWIFFPRARAFLPLHIRRVCWCWWERIFVRERAYVQRCAHTHTLTIIFFVLCEAHKRLAQTPPKKIPHLRERAEPW